MLTDRVASLLWRLHRAVRYETEMIEVYLQDIPEDMAIAANYAEGALGMPRDQTITPQAVEQQVSRRLLPTADTLAKVMRYEAHLHRQYLQTLHELEAIQARRHGQPAPLARLDISAPPSL